MSAQSMLEQLLRSGLSSLDGAARGLTTQQPGGISPFGKGTLTGGALGLLLGSRRGRKVGGSALKMGGVAALGLLAYKAFTQWQSQQQAAQPTGAAPAASPTLPQTVNLLPPPLAEIHAQAMLKAMIAAAKCDGHMDDRERSLVQAELQRLDADPALQRWTETELQRPLDPAEVAQAATTPEIAAEMYLASLLVADETTTMERLYLDELARQLKLPDGLKRELEQQALAAS